MIQITDAFVCCLGIMGPAIYDFNKQLYLLPVIPLSEGFYIIAPKMKFIWAIISIWTKFIIIFFQTCHELDDNQHLVLPLSLPCNDSRHANVNNAFRKRIWRHGKQRHFRSQHDLNFRFDIDLTDRRLHRQQRPLQPRRSRICPRHAERWWVNSSSSFYLLFIEIYCWTFLRLLRLRL